MVLFELYVWARNTHFEMALFGPIWCVSDLLRSVAGDGFFEDARSVVSAKSIVSAANHKQSTIHDAGEYNRDRARIKYVEKYQSCMLCVQITNCRQTDP